MHHLSIVLLAVSFLYAQGYEIKYEFSFTVNTGSSPTGGQIKIAAEQAVIGLGITGAKISNWEDPIVQNGVWSTVFGFTIPDSYSQTKATTQFTSKDFSTDLQSKLSDQDLEGIKITAAKYTGGDGATVIATIPDNTPSRVACGKDPVVAGFFAIFLATFGVARFYYGYILAGVFKLLLGLFAHCGNAIAGNVAKRDDDKAKCGKCFVLITFFAEIGFFVWWIYDMVVIWNHSLKPFDKPDTCYFA